MPNCNDRLWYLVVLLFWCGTGCQTAQLQPSGQVNVQQQVAGEEDVLVLVVHESNPVANLSKYELKMFFLGQKRFWPNAEEIASLNFPRDTEERESFSQIVFNQSAYRLQRYWIRATERGYPAKPPMEIARANRILAFVHRHKSAIGYVRLSDYNYFKQTKQYKIKSIKLEESEPTLEAAKNGSYRLHIVYRIPLLKT